MPSSVIAIPRGHSDTSERPQAASALPPAPHRILLTASLRWPLAARLAIAFADLGCHVEALCPRGHPLTLITAARRVHRHRALAPLGSLRDAIAAAIPDLIVPCDDGAALHLDALHRQAGSERSGQTLRTLIELSLGAPAACTLATSREALMALASSLGVRHPGTAAIEGPAELAAWIGRHGLPAVLKLNRSWGGQGVAIVHTLAEAQAALARLCSPPSLRTLAVRLLLDRDWTPLWNRVTGPDPAVSVQNFIAGTPANRAVACWRGEVLAGTSVEAVETQDATGPATVVRVIDNREMTEAARRLVAHLGLSGFWGFDFVLGANAACLIEVNPRATPVCPLPAGDDLPASLLGALTGQSCAIARSVAHEVIALFPGETRRQPDSVHLYSAWHDVPWNEPALVQDCLAKPWAERGWIARLWAWIRPRKAGQNKWNAARGGTARAPQASATLR